MSRATRQSLLPLTRDQREWLRLEVDQRRREVVKRQGQLERAAKRRKTKAQKLLDWSRSLDERAGRVRS